MKRKPEKLSPKSPTTRDRYVLGLLILLFAGLVYYKFSEFTFFNRGPVLRVLINVSSTNQQKQIAPLVENFSKSMEKEGFELKFLYASTGEERKKTDYSEWDISLANSINALVILRKNASISILAAKKNCSIGTQLLVNKNSLMSDIGQLKQKKIYIFSNGTINPLLLKTANQLKESRFEVIDDQTILNKKINTEPDFVLLANTHSSESMNQYPGLKVFHVSPFKIPCRFLLASNKVPRPIIKKFLEVADFSANSLLSGYEIISEEQFGAIFQSFPWKEINRIRTELLNK